VGGLDGGGEEDAAVGILTLPEEIILRIFRGLDPFDVWSVARTCKHLNNISGCPALWKYHWTRLVEGAPFRFPSPQNLQDLGVCFQDAVRRLCRTLCSGAASIPKCSFCKEYTCVPSCLQQRSSKIVVDIGGKMTWVITGDFSLRNHLSMMAVPKLLRCYDCDATIDRGETVCDCRDEDLLKWNLPPCRYKAVSSHTGLQYCSQQLGGLVHQERYNQPLCLFCEKERVSRMLCEKEMVIRTKDKLSTLGHPYSLEETFRPVPSFLSNGYCQDTVSFVGAENLDLLSPLIALEHFQAFPLVKAYIDHLFMSFKMLDDLQRPNSCLVFTEPSNVSSQVKQKLLSYLFEEVQIARLCFLPKALAIALLFEKDTCIVIDSGATCTSVWVVLDGRVDTARTRRVGVGGWHLSEYLKQALSWKETSDTKAASVSSLDTADVKEKCRLSLNVCREESKVSGRTETLHVRSQVGTGRSARGGCSPYGGAHGRTPAEYSEITFTSELYLAPEMMYASLDLPGMVSDATRDLPQQFIKDTFSNILVTGGNSDLQGFMARLSCDLRERIPEHSAVINISSFPSGNHSWNTAMGANMIKVAPPYEDILQLHVPGTPFWISREEYIIFGSHQLPDTDPLEEM